MGREHIYYWKDVPERGKFKSILVGNGFSRNIWEHFAYSSLFKALAEDDDCHNLTDDALRLFTSLNTHNFETVLSKLKSAQIINDCLGVPNHNVDQKYLEIRAALATVVRDTHIPWANFCDAVKRKVGDALSQYRHVYTTNYDLVIYWSIVERKSEFKDFFWSSASVQGANVFNPKNVGVFGNPTRVYYVHGGLHLYRMSNGQTLKRVPGEYENILDIFGTRFHGAEPLFISEGSWEEKVNSISRSEYLDQVFKWLRNDRDPLVVFGQSMSDEDWHIVDLLNTHPSRPLAISLKGDESSKQKAALRYRSILPDNEISFFDAETHPLGSKELNIQ